MEFHVAVPNYEVVHVKGEYWSALRTFGVSCGCE
jgi:hypothetical protein